jgi:hypothetical protein
MRKWRMEVTVPSSGRRTWSATTNGDTMTLLLRNAALGRQTDARFAPLGEEGVKLSHHPRCWGIARQDDVLDEGG